MNKVKKTLVALLVISLVTVAFLIVKLSVATPPSLGAKFYIYPEKVEDPTLKPNSAFWINMTVYNVTNMVYCEFNVSYTPSIFVVSQIQKIAIQGQNPSAYTDADDLNGYVYVRLTYKQPITLFETDAQLLGVQFTVINYGSTILDLHNTTLKDSNGYLIPHKAGDGWIWIIKHDIALVDIAVSTNEIYVGRNITITVKVKNEGNIDESNVTVSIYANEKLIGILTTANLSPSEVKTILFNWDTLKMTPNNTPYKIKAEVNIIEYDTNTTNNSFLDGTVKIKLIGDINGDGIVNINDLTLWDSAFNSKSTDQKWNPQADINNDGVVDKIDGILIVQNYKNIV